MKRSKNKDSFQGSAKCVLESLYNSLTLIPRDQLSLVSIPENTLSLLNTILNGSNITFVYMLFTALLAKATDEQIDPFILQISGTARTNLRSYDARSLCHNVVVPFEREHLAGVMGGSNEPFLNKPARYQKICESNPTRTKNLQKALCNLLSYITSSQIAKSILYELLTRLEKKKSEKKKSEEIIKKSLIDKKEGTVALILEEFLALASDCSYGGATATVTAVLSLKLLFEATNSEFHVCAHPLNESGASSKETSDIDIKNLNDDVVLTMEVKDKTFTVSDVEHAARKVSSSKIAHTTFLTGFSAHLEDCSKKECITRVKNSVGVEVHFLDLRTLVKTAETVSRLVSAHILYQWYLEVTKICKVSQAFLDHCHSNIWTNFVSADSL